MTKEDTHAPTLTDGVTYLDAPSPRTTAIHRLTLAEVADLDGCAYWIDSRSTASTYALLEGASHHRMLDSMHIARAFTAYQHHSLVQTVASTATRADLVVLPCLDALYVDDDVPTPQANALFADTLAALTTLGDAGAAVVVTAGSEPFATDVVDHADRCITVRETDLGLAFDGEGVQTTVYRGPGFWQTTIPYWVDLLGPLEEGTALVAEPYPMQAALG